MLSDFFESRRLREKETENSLMIELAYSQIYHIILPYTHTTTFSHVYIP